MPCFNPASISFKVIVRLSPEWLNVKMTLLHIFDVAESVR